MTDSPDVKNRPKTDFAETIAFLKSSPGIIEGLSGGNAQEKFNVLPRAVRRLLMNFADKDWQDVRELMEKAGVEDRTGLDSIRPFVDHFRTVASKRFRDIKMRSELRKDYSGIGAIKANYLFEMSIGTPILHLKFLDDEEEVLFESRETTVGMLGNAIGIMVAVGQSFELCRDRNLVLSNSHAKQVKESLQALMKEIKGIASALNIHESDLIEAFSVSRTNLTERTEGEQADVRNE